MILSYEGYAPHIEKPPRNKNNKFRNYAKNITNKLKIKKKKKKKRSDTIILNFNKANGI